MIKGCRILCIHSLLTKLIIYNFVILNELTTIHKFFVLYDFVDYVSFVIKMFNYSIISYEFLKNF